METKTNNSNNDNYNEFLKYLSEADANLADMDEFEILDGMIKLKNAIDNNNADDMLEDEKPKTK